MMGKGRLMTKYLKYACIVIHFHCDVWMFLPVHVSGTHVVQMVKNRYNSVTEHKKNPYGWSTQKKERETDET